MLFWALKIWMRMTESFWKKSNSCSFFSGFRCSSHLCFPLFFVLQKCNAPCPKQCGSPPAMDEQCKEQPFQEVWTSKVSPLYFRRHCRCCICTLDSYDWQPFNSIRHNFSNFPLFLKIDNQTSGVIGPPPKKGFHNFFKGTKYFFKVPVVFKTNIWIYVFRIVFCSQSKALLGAIFRWYVIWKVVQCLRPLFFLNLHENPP